MIHRPAIQRAMADEVLRRDVEVLGENLGNRLRAAVRQAEVVDVGPDGGDVVDERRGDVDEGSEVR